MTEEKAHYNLYYIFLEDKEAHPLPPARAADLWIKIQKAIAKSPDQP